MLLPYAPILSESIRGEMGKPNRSWRVDETYVRVAGRWTYLYRAVDSEGNTIDFMLSPNRDLTAAKQFLQLAMWRTREVRPRVINVDGHPAYARAMAELKSSGELGRRCRCRADPAWRPRSGRGPHGDLRTLLLKAKDLRYQMCRTAKAGLATGTAKCPWLSMNPL